MNSILSIFNVGPFVGILMKNFTLSMMLTGFPWVAGTSFLIYLAGLNNISEEIYDAASLMVYQYCNESFI